jgi:hypothetical protein
MPLISHHYPHDRNPRRCLKPPSLLGSPRAAAESAKPRRQPPPAIEWGHEWDMLWI